MKKTTPLPLDYSSSQGDDYLLRSRLKKYATADALIFAGLLFSIPLAALFTWSPNRKNEQEVAGYCGFVFLAMTIFEVLARKTVGMKLYKLNIRDSKGEIASLFRVLARSIQKNLLFLLLYILISPERILSDKYYQKHDVEIYILTKNFFMPFMVILIIAQLWGLIMAASGKKDFLDRLCGTKVGE